MNGYRKIEPKDGKIIPGIHHYCNRWCEKCTFKQQCSNFNFSTKLAEALSFRDCDTIGSRKTEQNIKDIQCVVEFIDEMLSGTENQKPEISKQTEIMDLSEMDLVMKNSLYVHASKCCDMMTDWLLDFKDDSCYKSCFCNDDNTISGAVDVIHWNRPLVLSKIYRALSGKHSDKAAVNSDVNGSMKVVLVAIDDLFSAWYRLLQAVPSQESDILDILQYLTILKDNINFLFPLAECFIRPGFDTIDKSTA